MKTISVIVLNVTWRFDFVLFSLFQFIGVSVWQPSLISLVRHRARCFNTPLPFLNPFSNASVIINEYMHHLFLRADFSYLRQIRNDLGDLGTTMRLK